MTLDYVFWLFIFMKVPETKNKSISEIVGYFRDRAFKSHPEKVHLHSTSASSTVIQIECPFQAKEYEVAKKAVSVDDGALKSTDA